MRLIVTIPHFYKPEPQGRYGSCRPDVDARVKALRRAIVALHEAFPARSGHVNFPQRSVTAGPPDIHLSIKVVTTGGDHLVDRLGLANHLFEQVALDIADPMMLGLECHRALAAALPDHTHFAYMEDDLVLHDAALIEKLTWFNSVFGDGTLLQPNRYEARLSGDGVRRLYVDGPLRPFRTAPYLTDASPQSLSAVYGARSLRFEKALNPHAGCFFLNKTQMSSWAQAVHFCDGDRSFVGPLESNATLGLLKTFTVYKTVPRDGDFVHIEHSGSATIEQTDPGGAFHSLAAQA